MADSILLNIVNIFYLISDDNAYMGMVMSLGGV
jgi:hypothetical protein